MHPNEPKANPNRIIHLSHYVPSICHIDNDGVWTIEPRRGHSAMNLAIKSLNKNYDNYHMGYIGKITAPDGTCLNNPKISEENKAQLYQQLKEKNNYLPVFLSEEEAYSHYEGYCKTELWPMFHYLLEDMKGDMASQKKKWDGYVSVNQHFADALVAFYEPEDFIWIHDYHLMLVPEMIRKVLPNAKIGFFLHAPFPSSEIFRSLSTRKEILKGILASNLIGLQTYAYARHLVSTCIRVLGLEPAPEGIDYYGSIVTVATFPIGVDVQTSESHIKTSAVQEKVKSLTELYSGKKVIFGRDKLDQATGVLQKFQTYELFLQKFPEWKGKVILVQVTNATQSNPDLEKKVNEVVARINSTYGSLEYSPVHHFQHKIAREEYYSLLTIADVALITSVRDGMNTTSHEFILSQKNKFSPLILSEFTGTAGSLKEAILVNPFNFSGVAEAINDALKMPHDRKVEAHTALYKRVTTQDGQFWANSFVDAMKQCCATLNSSNTTPVLDTNLIASKYKSSKKRLLLFDYDGTLTEIVAVPSAAVPSARMLEGLKELTKDPNNVVWIISGRDQKALIEWMGDVPNLGLSAEHGCFMKEPQKSNEDWINLAQVIDLKWQNDVTQIFNYYTERTQGSFIEHKRASLTWHYRMADPDFGSFQAKECQNHLENAVVSKLPVEILIGKKNIEVRPISINKGEIVKKLLAVTSDYDFVFCAGDDKTDEDMFRALKPTDRETSIEEDSIFSCTIGSSNKKTLAKWHLASPQQIIDTMHTMVDSTK